MIAKRIRKSARAARGSIERLRDNIVGLTKYVIDARPWPDVEPGHIRSLSAYVLHASDDTTSPGEKVAATWVSNLQSTSLADQQIEMLAISARATRGRDPVEHIVYSWPSTEQPNAAQVEEAGRIILDVLGYSACPAICAFHANTSHAHGHLAVVRVDARTGSPAGDGWDLDRLAQARAIIEERQGWASEKGAKYTARGGAVYDIGSGRMVRDAGGNQSDRKRTPHAERSPKTGSIEISILAAIAKAKDWQDLHDRLRPFDTDYDRKGSGAILRIGDRTVKPSAIAPSASRTALEKRLGPFVSDRVRQNTGYEQYQAACRDRLAALRESRADERQRLKSWFDAALAAVQPSPHPALIAAMRNEYQTALAGLNHAFAGAIDTFARSRLTVVAWETAGRPPMPALTPVPMLILPPHAFAERTATTSTIFKATETDQGCQYRNARDELMFVDFRMAIIVHHRSNATVDEALRLAHARWGVVRVHGDTAFLRRSIERATLLQIPLIDEAGRSLTGDASMQRSVPTARAESSKLPAPALTTPAPDVPPSGKTNPDNASTIPSPAAEVPDMEDDHRASAFFRDRQERGR